MAMAEKTAEFTYGDQKKVLKLPVTPVQLLDKFGVEERSDNPILGAVLNQHLLSFQQPLDRGGSIEFINYHNRYGKHYYHRGMTLILGLACSRIFKGPTLQIGHSLEHGYYYHLAAESPVSEETLDKIGTEMKKIINSGLPFKVNCCSHKKALETFARDNQVDKVRLLNTWETEMVEVHQLDNYLDLAYFPAPGNTGQLKTFELRPYTPGFILRFPARENIHKIPAPKDQPKLFQIYQETKEWAKVLEVDNAGALNEVIEAGEISEFIKISEALHEKKISRIADEIKNNLHNIDLVTIAGPSSSGKTTFAKRLSIQLRVHGIKPVRISTDDYFVPREETPQDEEGNYNFEALEAIDLELFNKHLIQLQRGEEIQLPQFSFETGRRKSETIPLELTEDQLLIVEGIHGLNPRLTEAVDRHRKYLIYVSALTQLVIDGHNRISTSDSRLIRRIVRDMLFRDITTTTNINRWPSVRRGENEYIFPYQERADSMFNSSLLYELAALKPYIESALKEVDEGSKAFRTAHRIQRFINLFKTIDIREIPPTSILREFIGGSSFNY